MRKRLLVGLVGLAGCWTSSSKPASEPRLDEDSTRTGGATYAGLSSSTGSGRRGSGPSSQSDRDTGGDQPRRTGSTGTSGGTSGGTGTGTSGGTGTGTGGSTGSGIGMRGGVRTGLHAGGGSSGPPRVTISEPTVGPSAALDPAIIRRYIRRHLPKIQYCYEKELLSAPGLEGRVNVRFSIGADGRVTQSTGSGMPPVDECVARAIATIEFPKPTGGVVIVNYPFIFQQAEPAPDPSATP
jgi:outer membrane biosynthesis protein TonB